MQVISACRCRPVQDRPSKWPKPNSCFSCWCPCSQTQRALMAAASARSAVRGGRLLDRNWLHLGRDGAGEAELGDLAGEVRRLLLGRAPVEVVGPEVAPEGAVAQHVPDGREHGGGDGADGLLGAAALAQPLELRPEIAVLLAA